MYEDDSVLAAVEQPDDVGAMGLGGDGDVQEAPSRQRQLDMVEGLCGRDHAASDHLGGRPAAEVAMRPLAEAGRVRLGSNR